MSLVIPKRDIFHEKWSVIFHEDKHTFVIRKNNFWGGIMVKIAQMIEFIKEDVNNEESMTLTFFNRVLQTGFQLAMLLGIPFLIYVLTSFGKLP